MFCIELYRLLIMSDSVLNYVVLLKQRTCVQTDRAMRIPSAKGNTSAIYNAGASETGTLIFLCS